MSDIAQATNADQNKSKTTPQAQGVAPYGPLIENLNRDEVAQLIAEDVNIRKEVDIKSLLTYLLGRIRLDKEFPPDDSELLEELLNKIEAKCINRSKAETHSKTETTKSEWNPSSSELIGLHTKFTASKKTEAESYGPWIRMTNVALAMLKTVELDLVEIKSISHDIISIRNDPKTLEYNHNATSVYLPQDEATPADWNKIAAKIELEEEKSKKPRAAKRGWEDVYYCCEHKRAAPTIRRVGLGISYLSQSSGSAKRPLGQESPDIQKSRKAAKKSSTSSPGQSSTPLSSSMTMASDATSLSVSDNTTSEFDDTFNQAAEYAIARLGAFQAVTHAIGSVREGNLFTIQWYDLQGVVSTYPIDIYDIANLPLYLAFLFIVQRFDTADWGMHPDFLSNPNGDTVITVDGKKFELGKKVLHKQWGIKGRSTSVIDCVEVGKPATRCVIKVAFPEETRHLEHNLIDEAKRRGAGDPRVEGHIPEYVAYREYKETSTSKIRRFLKLPSTGSRRLYSIVLIKFDGMIRELEGNQYWHVWWDCFDCHFALWKAGFRHRDISDSNLMYKKTTDSGKVVGVLSDFDLSSLETDEGRNTGRTGTFPFMARDLLTPEGLEGKIRHEYKHDAEAFFWVVYMNTALYPAKERHSDNAHVKQLIECMTGRVPAINLLQFKRSYIAYPSDHIATPSQRVCWTGFRRVAKIWKDLDPDEYSEEIPTTSAADIPRELYRLHAEVRQSHEANYPELGDAGRHGSL
ncbi:hypothetical protein PIIN_07869 [Serendipita indica DSM 11827]|uniref:Fungal-type protein kinase domain-containing protein n=1 Tax=Serendipita indica (strain DSM 11827) TaxID=1109443 RepID=G4TRG9_SERID|nr:hypothetical protein PIIN_07869 [Serendipita indica DSM 11827]